MLYALQELEELLGMGNGKDGDRSSTGTSRNEVVLGTLISTVTTLLGSLCSHTGVDFTLRLKSQISSHI